MQARGSAVLASGQHNGSGHVYDSLPEKLLTLSVIEHLSDGLQDDVTQVHSAGSTTDSSMEVSQYTYTSTSQHKLATKGTLSLALMFDDSLES